MSKKREDNRDVFEKALDPDVFGGGVAGAIAANVLARKLGKRFKKRFSSDPDLDQRAAQDADNMLESIRWKGGGRGAASDAWRAEGKMRRGRLAGNAVVTAAGGGAGGLVGSEYSKSKRRK